jgi:hypothetical protein
MKKIKRIVAALLIAFVLVGGMTEFVPAFGSVATVEAASMVKLNKSKSTLYVGATVNLKLKNAKTSKVKWSSSKKSVAKVSAKGKVTALKKGTAVITAKYNKKSYKCKITVKSAKLSEKKLTLQVGYGYSVELLNAGGKVKWKSSNETVAKVNANGYIIPRKTGKTKITAKAGNETYTCNLKVVAKFTEDDFIFDEDESDAEGYTNYIDYCTGEGSGWYWYWDSADTVWKCNRGINVGDTYDDFISAYGYSEYETVSSSDRFNTHFSNSAYPRTKIILDYKDESTQNHYYKSFYFDKNGTLVLITWYR